MSVPSPDKWRVLSPLVVVTGWVKPAVPGTRTRVGTGTGREFRTRSVGGRAEIAR